MPPTHQTKASLELGWDAANPEFVQLVRAKSTGLLSSQVCEDTFNFAKNSAVVKGKRRFRRIEKVMGVPIARKVLSSVHNFQELQVDQCAPCATAKLGPECFRPSDDSALMPLAPIAGTSQAPSWYAPQARTWSQPAADLHMLSEARRTNCWEALGRTFLGCVFESRHKFVFTTVGSNGQWFFPVHHFPDSVVLAFPAIVVDIAPKRFFVPTAGATPTLLSVTTWDDIQACSYTWASPASQAAMGAVAQRLPPAVRAMATTEPMSLKQLAARQAYWTVDKSSLKKLAEYQRLTVPKGSTIVDILMSLARCAYPQASEDDLMDMCCVRLGAYMKGATWSEELCQMDEAVEVLSTNDHKTVSEERKKAKMQEEEAVEFRDHYKTSRTSLKSGMPKNSRKRSAAAGLPKKKLPKWPHHNISVAVAKDMRPPGSSLWCCERFGNWQGHMAPFPRVSRSWSKYGEGESLNIVLRTLWQQWCEQHAVPIAEVPIQGLFPAGGSSASDAGARGTPSASASSSSRARA